MTRYVCPWGDDVCPPTRTAPVPALPHVDDLDLVVERDDDRDWAAWGGYCPCGSDLLASAEVRRVEADTDEHGQPVDPGVVESVVCPVCYADALTAVLRHPARDRSAPVHVMVEPRWFDQSGAGRLVGSAA